MPEQSEYGPARPFDGSLVPNPRFDDLAEEIRYQHAVALQAEIRCGELLTEVKGRIYPSAWHGWLAWVGLRRLIAYRYMYLAERHRARESGG